MKKAICLFVACLCVNQTFAKSNFSMNFGLSMDYIFLNSTNMKIHKNYQMEDMSLKFNHFTFHPIIGFDYAFSENFLFGVETGLIALNNMINGSKKVGDKIYSARHELKIQI